MDQQYSIFVIVIFTLASHFEISRHYLNAIWPSQDGIKRVNKGRKRSSEWQHMTAYYRAESADSSTANTSGEKNQLTAWLPIYAGCEISWRHGCQYIEQKEYTECQNIDVTLQALTFYKVVFLEKYGKFLHFVLKTLYFTKQLGV